MRVGVGFHAGFLESAGAAHPGDAKERASKDPLLQPMDCEMCDRKTQVGDALFLFSIPRKKRGRRIIILCDDCSAAMHEAMEGE
jgi:hypothetical protein